MRVRCALLLALGVAALLPSGARADGPADNAAEKVRPIPPHGTPIPDTDRQALTAGLEALTREVADTRAALRGRPALLELLPDVEVYAKAVRYALEFDEMYSDGKSRRDDVATAKDLLARGGARAKELRDGKPSWPTATGLVVRGYRSKIDGSVQPYGLVVPKSFAKDDEAPRRLDFWWHGRGETLTELDFIRQRQTSPGDFTPRDAFVVHPYGRYCNANKFAGEIDTLEVLDHVKKHYPIDESRVVARGFSMGGAACWQFTVHYPMLWAASAPGAGFAETPEFLNVFQNEKVTPTWYEKKLWRLYNATDSALNISNVPTVAYSGELDKQKQAADIMARAVGDHDMQLTHIIGPKTGHAYEAGAKAEVSRRIDKLVKSANVGLGRGTVRFTTFTLRYNDAGAVRVEGLQKHWERGTVAFEDGPGGVGEITTQGVSALRVTLSPGARLPRDQSLPRPLARRDNEEDTEETVIIDGDAIPMGHPTTDGSFEGRYARMDGKWRKAGPQVCLAKVPGLQGPIDDAFMDAFLMVKPTGTAMNEAIGAWTRAEMDRAIGQWRKQFRGDAPVKLDKEVTEADIANNNLILWGDPQSNAVLAKIVDRLPLKEFTGTTTTALIYPNPLNPKKYVVLNSGFTFREYDQLNNARQVPKLPDYAVIDVTTPPGPRAPGKVTRAGFFNEKWELRADDGK